MEKPIVQYFFVNTELGMSKGKMCSQVAHASQMVTEEIIRSAYESNKPPEYYTTYMKWKKGCAKIVLKATTEQLKELMKMDHCVAIIDSGKTQIEPGSLTCIAFYPSSMLGDLFKGYKLL